MLQKGSKSQQGTERQSDEFWLLVSGSEQVKSQTWLWEVLGARSWLSNPPSTAPTPSRKQAGSLEKVHWDGLGLWTSGPAQATGKMRVWNEKTNELLYHKWRACQLLPFRQPQNAASPKDPHPKQGIGVPQWRNKPTRKGS